MQSRSVFLVTGAMLLTLSTGWSQADERKTDPAANAALRYWRAFDATAGLSKEQEKLLESWQSAPFDQASAMLVKDNSALKEFRRGADAAYCDWGLEYEDGPGMMFNHVARARTLCRLACLRARWKFHEGKTHEAVDDVAATFVLGRHVGKDPTFISILVDYAIEQSAMEVVQQNFAKLDVVALKSLAARVDSLPATATLSQCVDSERDHMCGWLINWLKRLEADKSPDWKEQIGRAFGLGPENEEVKKLLGSANTPAELRQITEQVLPFYPEMKKLQALPRDQFDVQWTAFHAKMETNPIARLVTPQLQKVRVREEKFKVQMALFRAALAIGQDGPEKARDFPDPAGSGPVTYKPIPGGFAVQSQLKDDKGQPVTFYAGQAPRQHPEKK